MLERVALPREQDVERARARREIGQEKERKELKKRWGKFAGTVRRSRSKARWREMLARPSRRMRGMKRRKGTPTYVGRMKDRSRLGQGGKALVKALQNAMARFPFFELIPKVTAVVDPSTKRGGPTIELSFDPALVVEWGIGYWERGREIRDDLNDEYNDLYQDRRAPSDVEDRFHEDLRERVKEAVSDEFRTALVDHLKGGKFSVSPDRDATDALEGFATLDFTPGTFGLGEEWAPRTAALLREVS